MGKTYEMEKNYTSTFLKICIKAECIIGLCFHFYFNRNRFTFQSYSSSCYLSIKYKI